MKTSTADANREGEREGEERDGTRRVFSPFSSRMNGDEIQLAAAWLAVFLDETKGLRNE